MTFDSTTPIWITTPPTPVSTIDDCVFSVMGMQGLDLQVRGGLNLETATLHSTKVEALKHLAAVTEKSAQAFAELHAAVVSDVAAW